MAVAEFVGADAQLADVLDAVRTLPFLAPRRLALVREADDFLSPRGSGSERVRDALVKYLEAPAPTGSLCLEVATWSEATRLAKRVAEVGVVVACEAGQPDKIPGWLQTQARKAFRKTLSYGAARMLQEHLGPDFAALTNALEMLALYVGDAPAIGEAEVDALVARGHHERVWELCDAVAEQRLTAALALLDAFWTEGMQAPQFAGLLRSTFRQLVRVQALAGRMSLDDAMRQAGVPWAAANRVRRAIQAFSEADLADAYQALVDADLECKTTANERLALETLIHRLANPAAARGLAAGREP